MERTLTNMEIFNAIAALDAALQEDGVPSVATYRAVRNLKILNEHREDFEETRNKKLKEYADTDENDEVVRHEEEVTDEDGKVIHKKDDAVFSDGQQEAFEDEMKELLNDEVKVEGIKIIKLSQLKDWDMPAPLAFHCDFMFEDDI